MAYINTLLTVSQIYMGHQAGLYLWIEQLGQIFSHHIITFPLALGDSWQLSSVHSGSNLILLSPSRIVHGETKLNGLLRPILLFYKSLQIILGEFKSQCALFFRLILIMIIKKRFFVILLKGALRAQKCTSQTRLKNGAFGGSMK